jgi:hypothetical protein
MTTADQDPIVAKAHEMATTNGHHLTNERTYSLYNDIRTSWKCSCGETLIVIRQGDKPVVVDGRSHMVKCENIDGMCKCGHPHPKSMCRTLRCFCTR